MGGGGGGGGRLWRRDCKLVRIKVMNINHGRLVLRSFAVLDGLSPLHRRYRPAPAPAPAPPPRLYPLSSLLPATLSSILHYPPQGESAGLRHLRSTCAHTSFLTLRPPLLPSSSRCQSAGPLFTPVRVHVSLARTPPSRDPLLPLPLPVPSFPRVENCVQPNLPTLQLSDPECSDRLGYSRVKNSRRT